MFPAQHFVIRCFFLQHAMWWNCLLNIQKMHEELANLWLPLHCTKIYQLLTHARSDSENILNHFQSKLPAYAFFSQLSSWIASFTFPLRITICDYAWSVELSNVFIFCCTIIFAPGFTRPVSFEGNPLTGSLIIRNVHVWYEFQE